MKSKNSKSSKSKLGKSFKAPTLKPKNTLKKSAPKKSPPKKSPPKESDTINVRDLPCHIVAKGFQWSSLPGYIAPRTTYSFGDLTSVDIPAHDSHSLRTLTINEISHDPNNSGASFSITGVQPPVDHSRRQTFLRRQSRYIPGGMVPGQTFEISKIPGDGKLEIPAKLLIRMYHRGILTLRKPETSQASRIPIQLPVVTSVNAEVIVDVDPLKYLQALQERISREQQASQATPPPSVPQDVQVTESEEISYFAGATEDPTSEDLYHLTQSPQTEIVLLPTDPNDVIVSPNTELGRKMQADLDTNADYYAGEFVRLMTSWKTREIRGQTSGEELDDPVAAMTTGRGFSQEITLEVPKLRLTTVLDFSGSTFSSGLFFAISQVGYFIDRIARKMKADGNPAVCETIGFASLAKKFIPNDVNKLAYAFDWLHHMSIYKCNDDFRGMLNSLGGSTSILSAITLSVADMDPHEEGILVVVTDGSLGNAAQFATALNQIDIPPHINPILISIGIPLADVLKDVPRWSGFDIKVAEAIVPQSLLGVVMNHLVDTIADVRSRHVA